MTKLLFIGGGPWDDKELDSRVEDAPDRIGPTPDRAGIYERLGAGVGDVFVYVWRADEFLDTDARFEHCAEPDRM
jgi:hypothetical protein